MSKRQSQADCQVAVPPPRLGVIRCRTHYAGRIQGRRTQCQLS